MLGLFMPKSVSNLIMRGIFNELTNHGVNTKFIFENCDISEYEMNRENGRIPEHKHYRFMLQALDFFDLTERLHSTDFISHSFQNHPEFIGACLNECSAQDALSSYLRYRVVIGNCDEIIKSENIDKTKFEYINLGPQKLGSSQAIFNFIVMFHIAKNYSQNLNICVGFTEKQKQKSNLLNELFNTKCLWNQDSNYIIFNNHELEASAVGFNKNLSILQKNRLNDVCFKLENDVNYSSLIKEMIIHSIHLNRFEDDNSILHNICENLSISRWTLNRKLQNDNTSFLVLLKEAKIHLACDLLIKSNHTMQEISESIGFSSQSVFSRFFKSNLAVSPLAFRAEHGDRYTDQ